MRLSFLPWRQRQAREPDRNQQSGAVTLTLEDDSDTAAVKADIGHHLARRNDD